MRHTFIAMDSIEAGAATLLAMPLAEALIGRTSQLHRLRIEPLLEDPSRNVRTAADLQHIKVIVCSAKIFDVDRKNALKLGANEYISKITAASELVDKVNAVLGTA